MVLDRKDIEIFSSRDRIRNQLIEDMKYYLELEELDLNKSSFISYLVDIISATTANLMFYNSSIYREFFLTKALQKESVLNLAAMLGYTPPLAIPATCEVLITMPLEFLGNTFNVRMDGRKQRLDDPQPFRFYAKDNTVFTLKNRIDVEVNITGSAKSVNIIEYLSEEEGGGYRNLPYELSSDGNNLSFIVNTVQIDTVTEVEAEFTIPELKPYEFYTHRIPLPQQLSTKGNFISNLTLYSYANNPSNITTWNWKQSILLILQGENGFSYIRTEDGIRLFFGNDIVGTSPTVGDTFRTLIEITKGARGNVIAGSIIKTDRLSVTDSENHVRPVKLTAINPVPAINGEDAPTIDETRANAIARVSANSRFVSDLDYSNAEAIAEELPIDNTIHVLKRSDIKTNEVSLFTELLYYDADLDETYVVPTRNAVWGYDMTSNPYDIITKDDTITIDGTEYYSMFDIEIDRTKKETKFYYYQDNIEVPLALNRSITKITKVLPDHAEVHLIRNADPGTNEFNFELHYNIIDTDLDETDLTCTLVTAWDQQEIDMTLDAENNKFYLDGTNSDTVLVTTVPEGEQILKFKLYIGGSLVNESSTKSVIKKDLSEFMYSQIELQTDSTALVTDVEVYDVPVIQKAYYDNVDQSNFDLYVYQKIVTFDVTQYRMLTDFINLKFSNTTGKYSPMLYNKTTRDAVIDINPATLPSSPTVGDRYAVDCDENPWGIAGGFIAEYSETSPSVYEWVTLPLNVNDCMEVTVQDTKYVYNGEDLHEPVYDIPIELDIVVWSDKTLSGTNNGLIKEIKDSIVNHFYTKFGYNVKLYKSEISEVVRQVPGVLNCYVKRPETDIELTFVIKDDLTQAQLLRYAPSLVFFDTSSINVEVR